MWRERFIRQGWMLLVLNLLICLLQVFFAYSHYTRHEWWGVGISVFFVILNGYFAWEQIPRIARLKQELKDEMWMILRRDRFY